MDDLTSDLQESESFTPEYVFDALYHKKQFDTKKVK
jgi:hypothetical protein